MFNVIQFYIPWNVFLVPVTSKWTEIKKHILEKNTSDLLCDSVLHSNLEIRNWIKSYTVLPDFLSKKEEYYHNAQVDFDFGQVHIAWWLSYCQVEEKISVEPCSCTDFILVAPSCLNKYAE